LRTTGSERRSLFTTVVDHIDGETTVVLGLQQLWWSDAKSDAVLKILHTFCIRNPDYLPKGASGEDINATTESSMPTSIVFHIAVVTAIFSPFFRLLVKSVFVGKFFTEIYCKRRQYLQTI